MKKQPNIFLVGPMGAGKSSIGRLVAEKLGREFFDSDVVLEDRSGTSISWIFDVEGEPGMRKREIAVIEDLTQNENIVIATGGGAVTQEENRKVLAARGLVFYLTASIDQQFKRTARNKGHRPLLQVEDPRQRIIELMEVRDPLYREIADHIVETNRLTPKKVAQKIVSIVEKHQ